MTKLATFALVSGLCALATALVPRAKADEWDKTTVVKFSEPVEVPGVALSPGTYVFKLLDSPSDRDIVQVFNKDQTHLYATILAVPDYRLNTPGKTIVTFEERPKGTPEAVKEWFYPGDNYGWEFVYPKPRAMEIAKTTNKPVLSMPAEVAQNITKPIKSSSEAPAVALKQAPVKAVTPEQKEVEMAQAATPRPPAPTPAPELPKTGSELPLVGLIGTLVLALGLAARFISKRAA